MLSTRTKALSLSIGIGICILLIIGIYLLTHSSSHQTQTRSKAAGSTTLSFSNLPQPVVAGQAFPVDIQLDPGTNTVSYVHMSITYTSSTLTPDTTVITPNTSVMPAVMEGPTTQCNGTTCTLSISLGIGSDPTKVITSLQTIATLHFIAGNPTGSTMLAFGNDTQILATSSDPASVNLLSTAPATSFAIVAPTITTTNTPTFTPTVTNTPTPTQIPTPTMTPVFTSTPTPVAPQTGNTLLNLILHLMGIDGNTNLQHTSRQATVWLYKPTDDPASATPLYTISNTITYDNSTHLFNNTQFILGNIPTGQYQILVKSDQYLRKLVGQSITIQNGQTLSLAQQDLIPGDIFNENKLSITDYNAILSCFGSKANTSSCQNKNATDLNDDGVIDGIDYNIFLRSMSTILGQ